LNNHLDKAQQRARVLVLYAGGTFGMRAGSKSALLSPLSNVPAPELAAALGEYGRSEGIYWEFESLRDGQDRPVPPIDSSAVAPCHWIWLARSIERRYEEFDGFVIIHGTDTMAYTASALSFLLVNLAKPVVLTGSQLPLFASRSDAPQNFLNALWIAGYPAVGLPCISEVVVAFGELLLRGNRCRKASTSGWQGFVSPNFPALGVLGETPRIHHELLRPPPGLSQPFGVAGSLDDRVLDLTLFPGIRPGQIEALLSDELRGLVLRAYGAGNAPNDPQLLELLRRACASGKVVVVVSQCPEGIVELGRYLSSHALMECGVASGFDLTPEAALTKLMWLLGQTTDNRARFHRDLRGEQSFCQVELPFGDAPRLTLAPPRLRPTELERALLRLEGVSEEREMRIELSEGELGQQGEALSLTIELTGQDRAVVDITPQVRQLLPGERTWRLRLSGHDGAELRQPNSRLVLVSRC
jgi:L-asparaginase